MESKHIGPVSDLVGKKNLKAPRDGDIPGLEKDKLACKVVASTIASVIRRSMGNGDQFRDECYTLLRVSNTNDAEQELNKKLLNVVHGRRAKYDNSMPSQTLTNNEHHLKRNDASGTLPTITTNEQSLDQSSLEWERDETCITNTFSNSTDDEQSLDQSSLEWERDETCITNTFSNSAARWLEQARADAENWS